MRYLCIGEKFAANGKEQIKWHRIGEMFTGKNGKDYCKVYHMAGQLIHVFEDDKGKAKPAVDEFGADMDFK